MRRSIEASSKDKITIGDLRELFRSVPDTYVLCLDKNSSAVKHLEVNIVNDIKQCYLYIE